MFLLDGVGELDGERFGVLVEECLVDILEEQCLKEVAAEGMMVEGESHVLAPAIEQQVESEIGLQALLPQRRFLSKPK